jgi:serine/threonine protein phosphatase PrpC/cell division protein FtsL
MLGYYGMSLVGRSHLADEIPCQDAHGVKRLGENLIAAAIADGLGSAKYSDIGSTTAVETVLHFIEENMPLKWHEDTLKAMLLMAYTTAFKAIRKIAEEQGCDVREYDTTLTTLIYNGVNAVYYHVGDGGIIALSKYGEYSMLTSPQKGEEHNMTVPLRRGPDYWVFGSSKESICSLLMMTDGIYDIACPPKLAKSEQPIWIQFIRPFMDTNKLPVKTEEDFKKVRDSREAFFSGDDEIVKAITDDKTMVAVINTDEKPELKDYPSPDWSSMQKKEQAGLRGQSKAKSVTEAQEPSQASATGSEPSKPKPVQKSASSPVNTVRMEQPQNGQHIDSKEKNISPRNSKASKEKPKKDFLTSFLFVLFGQHIDSTEEKIPSRSDKASKGNHADLTTMQKKEQAGLRGQPKPKPITETHEPLQASATGSEPSKPKPVQKSMSSPVNTERMAQPQNGQHIDSKEKPKKDFSINILVVVFVLIVIALIVVFSKSCSNTNEQTKTTDLEVAIRNKQVEIDDLKRQIEVQAKKTTDLELALKNKQAEIDILEQQIEDQAKKTTDLEVAPQDEQTEIDALNTENQDSEIVPPETQEQTSQGENH